MIGEPQRAFYGSQFGNTFPLFAHYGVPLWVPEVGGPIDGDNEVHDLIMSVFGGMSKGERNRVKVCVRAAMAAQALMEGRYLGGRPPYGYRLCDLGPHPNPGKAADGKRLHGLELEPETAPVVVRIFTEFLRGLGIFAIAEGLTRDGIPSPSAHDRARNPHRDARAWAKNTVRAILTNPRYTGRQIWNRQSKYEVLLDIEDVSLGYTTAMRWNTQNKWIISKKAVHSPLVDDDTFARVQEMLRSRAHRGAAHPVHRTRNPYLFRGRIICGSCTRRMQAQWSHHDAYYRCRFPEEYALANRIAHPRNVYLRAKWISPPLDDWLMKVFQPHCLDDTVDVMAAAAEPERPIDSSAAQAETQARRVRAEADLRAAEAGTGTSGRMTRDEIARLVRSISDLTTVIRQADPQDKAEIYRRLGLQLTYTPGRQSVRVELAPDPHIAHNDKTPRSQRDRGEMVRVRGGT
ncbi:recombinase family protein [Streptomyces chattanoogensis]|uniref:recombinase family protein n=1 Tax=Streptomyces chattanoogensis TaxID=66876 RepID=UPI0036913B6F